MSWTYRIHGSRRLSEKRSSAACSMALDRELSQVRDRVEDRAASVAPPGPLPWITEAKSAPGRHEARDRSWPMIWPKRGGHSLGDPSKNPWCGDFVETCIRIGLPDEPLLGALGVQAVLEWAFRVEKAQLELPVRREVEEEAFGFGLEYVLLQRATLGCKVDGGQHKMGSYTHADAEIVAATAAGMPESLGGIRMAISMAELARAGITPDWMPGVVPRCVPVETKSNQHGERATTIVVGTERVLTRGKWRTVEVLACPVTWRPHPEQIAAARRGYEGWWQALDWVRDGLVAGRMLKEIELTKGMPKQTPW
jgi:hypothetical protein